MADNIKAAVENAVQGKRKALFDIENYSDFNELLADIERTPVRDIAQAMDRNEIDYFMYPSRWRSVQDMFKTKTPYPAHLAKGLVESKHSESLTDLLNMFYSRNRVYSPETVKVFQNHILSEAKNAQKMAGRYMLDEFSPNGMWEAANDSKMAPFLKKVFMMFPQSLIDTMAATNEFGGTFTKLGIDYDDNF